MRYFILSIVLSIVSFNSYGNVPKALDDLHNNRDLWIDSAKQAGLNNQEPEHLLEILEVEKVFFAEVLRYKESTIGNDPAEWKKHALASLLSYNAARYAAKVATLDIAYDTAFFAAYYAAGGVADNTGPIAVDADGGPAYNAGSVAYSAAIDVANNAALTATVDAVIDVARYAAKVATVDAARYAAYSAAIDAVKDAARRTSTHALKNLYDYNQIGRVAYRVTETQAWIKMLDPRLKTFEKAYNATYSKLTATSEEDLGEWFSSQEAFESKLNEYFVNNEELNDRSKEFLKHLQAHLSRMIPNMFPSN